MKTNRDIAVFKYVGEVMFGGKPVGIVKMDDPGSARDSRAEFGDSPNSPGNGKEVFGESPKTARASRALQRAITAAILCAILLTISGCQRMITPRNTQIVKDADKKAAEGDYLHAISMYEAALDDDSPHCADIHYKLALLYDDKMNDPLNALHHYKRYLTLEPTGSRATEVKQFMKRDEVSLATTLSGDAIVTRGEAARLKNENLALRKQLEERAAKMKLADKPDGPSAPAEGPKKAVNRKYVIQEGDTLYSIARKFYKSPSRWKEIRDANRSQLAGGTKLEPGETLTIP